MVLHQNLWGCSVDLIGLLCFCLLLQDRMVSTEMSLTNVSEDPPFTGIIISMDKARFEHSKSVLISMGFTHVEKMVPHHFQHDQHVIKREFLKIPILTCLARDYIALKHSDLKSFSNYLANKRAVEDFISDNSTEDSSWKFFFEDDIALHSDV
jgi:hypothetical protein